MMDFIGKLSGFVGKNLTYIVLVVVVAAYFMPDAFLWAVLIRFSCWESSCSVWA